MDYDYIFQLASDFRNALNMVANKKEYGRLLIFASFPEGCCAYTSDLLAEYLIENGVQKERIQRLNSESSKGRYTHCWLMIDDMYYLDITGDQFRDKPYFKKYGPIPDCCLVARDAREIYYFERFDNKSLEYSYNVGIGTYNGDIPDKLRNIYIAIVARITKNH